MRLDGNWVVSTEGGAFCYVEKTVLVAWGNKASHLSTIRDAYPTLPLGEFIYRYDPIAKDGITIYEFGNTHWKLEEQS